MEVRITAASDVDPVGSAKIAFHYLPLAARGVVSGKKFLVESLKFKINFFYLSWVVSEELLFTSSPAVVSSFNFLIFLQCSIHQRDSGLPNFFGKFSPDFLKYSFLGLFLV